MVHALYISEEKPGAERGEKNKGCLFSTSVCGFQGCGNEIILKMSRFLITVEKAHRMCEHQRTVTVPRLSVVKTRLR